MVKMGTVWDRTTEFLGNHLGQVLPIALAGIFVPATIWQTLEPLQMHAEPSLGAALVVIRIAQILVTVWAQVAITALAIEIVSGQTAARIALRRLPAVIGVGLVLLVALLLLLAPLFAILWASGVNLPGAEAPAGAMSPGGLAAAVLYGILLVPVLLILGARVILTTPVLVAERAGIRAITRSWALTRGLTAGIIGVVLLYIVVSLVAQIAAKSAFGAVLLLLLGGDGTINVAHVLTAIAVGIVATVFSVIQAAFVAKLYVATASGPARGATVPA
ncbi:hypothetical protein [Stakelama marina]|uniref:Glycerophosphoryl diester phosphodiesterase membrane domain-containing protein n=1 Tax=Stakelama marina TaxID=2826939 RepID=A0A8T4II30_9SPHN|nr:hypothetical protein [Stakelama marina]MBR0553702.1 hypothetical protein [Stakelama marina]